MMWIKKVDEPILVKEVELQGNNMGWLVIDSLGDGKAIGGVRLGKSVTLDEVKALAAEMTRKFSFLSLPIGGAKAGIRCSNPLSELERKDNLFRFGKGLGSLLREEVYLPGTDMGTVPADIDWLFQGADVARRSQGSSLDSGYYTAVSVFSALQGVSSVLGIPLSGARIGIQGLGKVGLRLFHIACEHGLKVVTVSTKIGALYSPCGLDPEQIGDLARNYGDNLISHYRGADLIQCEDLFEQDLEILCPCAALYPLHPGNMNKVRAKIVIPGCNVAAAPEVEERLYNRGIIYVPGFVSNSGGVLCYLLANYGFTGEELSNFLSQGIREKVSSLVTRAKKSGESPAITAMKVVRKNQERFTQESGARLKGKLSLAVSRLWRAGTKEMVRTFFWPLVKDSLSEPPSLKRQVAKTILFERLFQR